MKRLILAVCVASGTAYGDDIDRGWHIGIGAGRSSFEISELDVDEDATAWKAFAGYRLNQSLAVELAYIDGGTAEKDFGGGIKAEISGDIVQASLLGSYWFTDTASVFARLGANYYDAEAKASGPGGSIRLEDDGTEFGWGAGVQALLAGALWRLEYEAIEFEQVDSSLISLSIAWRL